MANLMPDVADLERQVNDWTKYFGIKNSLKTGMQDKNAFAHAYSSAQLVYDGGQTYSHFLGDAREARSYVTDSWKAVVGTKGYTVKGVFLDGNRDEFNNLVGRQIAQYALENGLPRSALGYLIADALKQGLLISDEGRDPRNTIGVLNTEEYVPSEALRGLMMRMYGIELNARCFPADTPIQTSLTSTKPISEIRVGDVVMAFDPVADGGRGALVPKRVKRLFRNTTTEWIKLTWLENGEAKELVATPGHHMLDKTGAFTQLDRLVKNGKAEVISAAGEVIEATATRITYSPETAHLFEQASSSPHSSANGTFAWAN
jgi:hypothetical protein